MRMRTGFCAQTNKIKLIGICKQKHTKACRCKYACERADTHTHVLGNCFDEISKKLHTLIMYQFNIKYKNRWSAKRLVRLKENLIERYWWNALMSMMTPTKNIKMRCSTYAQPMLIKQISAAQQTQNFVGGFFDCFHRSLPRYTQDYIALYGLPHSIHPCSPRQYHFRRTN